MLSVNSQSPWEMISGFNLTITRREKRQGMKLCSGLRTICETSLTRGIDPTAGSLLSAISATPDVNDSPVRGNFNVVYWLVEFFFPQLLSRHKRIEIIIKIKANFYKEIAQFTILVAIIGNKISKYFSLLAFRKYSIFLHEKHKLTVNLTRAIQRGMICFLFPTHQAVK